jgi:hypothetical protein
MTSSPPSGRPISVALLCLAMITISCADTSVLDSAEDDPMSSCTPLTSRACDCEAGFGPGTSTCLNTGDAWSDCVCLGDVSGDAQVDDIFTGGGLSPGFRAVSPLTATGKLTSPSYRLHLHVGPPSASEILVSPNYHLTLGAPAPPD